MKALTLTSLALALVLASPGEAKDIIDISAGNPSVAPAPQPDLAHLKRGDSSGDVSILQKALNDHGEHLTVDGIFGRQTEKAVKAFQAQSGLESTGEVDSGTWSALSNPARELETAKQDAGQAKAQAAEYARLLAGVNSELEKAKAQRDELQAKLDQATSEAETAQSQLKDKQSYLEGMQSELETAKQDAEQAKAQAAEHASMLASVNSELEKAKAQRDELQAKLDQATSKSESAQSPLKDKQPDLEQMQSELETAKQEAEQAKAKFAKLFASVNSELDNAKAQQSELETAKQDAEQAKAQAAEYASLLANLDASGDPQTSDSPKQPAQTFKPNEQPPTIYVGTPDTPAIATAHIKVGNILLARGDLAEALKSYRDGLAVAERLAAAEPENACVATQDHANFHQGRGRPYGARQFCGGAELVPGRSVSR